MIILLTIYIIGVIAATWLSIWLNATPAPTWQYAVKRFLYGIVTVLTWPIAILYLIYCLLKIQFKRFKR